MHLTGHNRKAFIGKLCNCATENCSLKLERETKGIKMNELLSHDMLMAFSKELLNDTLGIQVNYFKNDIITENGVQLAEKIKAMTGRGCWPDLYNDSIAVECGTIDGQSRDDHPSTTHKIQCLLLCFEKVVWIPYPELKSIGNVTIPTFRVIIYESKKVDKERTDNLLKALSSCQLELQTITKNNLETHDIIEEFINKIRVSIHPYNYAISRLHQEPKSST